MNKSKWMRLLIPALLTALFCAAALLFALLCGTPNGAPWYMLPLGFLVMIPFVGFAEEAGAGKANAVSAQRADDGRRLGYLAYRSVA